MVGIKKEMSRFDYPQLKQGEIISGLADYCNIVGVTDIDLRNPSPDFVSNIYTRLLFFLSILNEDYEQFDFSALEHLENPDNHRTSVRMMNLLKKMKWCLVSMDCPLEFCLKDLIMPNPDRTKMFLSSMVNFCVFRESKMEFLRPIVDEHRLIEEQGKELEDRLLQASAAIDEVNESKEREKPLVHAVDAKVKELRQTIPGLNNHQLSLKANLKKMKDNCKDLNEKISSAEFALVQSVQENASLRSRIVQSPDKLKKTLEEKKVTRAEARDAEKVSIQTYQEKNSTLEVFTKAHKKVSKSLVLVQSIQEQVNSAKTTEKHVKALRVQQSNEDMLDKTLEAELVEKQGRIAQVDESIKQLQKESDISYKEATEELNNVEFEVELKKRDLEARQKQIEAVVAEVEVVNVEINQAKDAGNAKRQQLAGKSEEIVSAFFKYNNSIGGQLPGMDVKPEEYHGSDR